jgi:hypothetical protein
MNAKLLVVSVVALFGALAGCDKAKDPGVTPAAQGTPKLNPQPVLSPKAVSSKDNLPPIQGQVDTKEPAQRRDFETKKP